MYIYKIQDPTNTNKIDPKKLSDNELYEKCQKYGTNAKVWLRKFAGLLPEVNKRKLYKKKGFISISEFAKKLCGMSEYTVERILNLSDRLEDKPTLRSQFESGLQGWSKIETVSFIATPKTEKSWAEKVGRMSKRVLESYVSQYRKILLEKSADGSSNKIILGDELLNIPKISQEFKFLSFQLSRQIEHKLRLFKQKLEKQRKENLSWNEVFKVLLSHERNSQLKREIFQKIGKDNFLRKINNQKKENQDISEPIEIEKASSRHIPEKIKRIIIQKYGTKCAYPNCNKPFDVFHHTKRYAIAKNHDPKFIVPLCDLHHNLVHSGFISNETDPPENWRIKFDQRIMDFKPG